MPNLADIVVKKNDGTTNVTYSGVVPAAGDASPARLRSTGVGSAPAHKPTLEIGARDNGNKTGRRVTLTFTYPSLVTSTSGAVTVADKAILSVSAILPNNMAQSDLDEFVAQGTNLVASPLIVSALKTGVSLT